MLVLVAVAPAWLAATLFLWHWDVQAGWRWSVWALVTLSGLLGALAARRRMVLPLQALANLLEALREGDYSQRGRNVDPRDAIGEVMFEVNSLGNTLHTQRLKALEAGMLLQKVIAEIDLAVFAFDAEGRLRLVNRAGERLLAASADEIVGKYASELGLGVMLEQEHSRIVPNDFPGGSGRWEIRRRSFREDGRPHELLVISELSRALREEERQAWQRLVRVIGHELNNSLAPIKSMASTLQRLLDRERLPDDWREDAQVGLAVIHDRSESLGRFMGAYARLTRLPAPARRLFEIPPLVRRVASLHGARVTVEAGPTTSIFADPDQIEQALINLVKNAVEAAGENGRVSVRWQVHSACVLFEIEDDGPGLARTDNLWVPFFTTKPGGTGIGLVLTRAIVENHGGSVSLVNRPDSRGCLAQVQLPRTEGASIGDHP